MQDLRFRNQVEWEIDHMKEADLVVVYLAAEGLSAVSLLELGLCAARTENGHGRVIVCCEPGYARRGNVQVVCARYGIGLLESLDSLVEEVKSLLEL